MIVPVSVSVVAAVVVVSVIVEVSVVVVPVIVVVPVVVVPVIVVVPVVVVPVIVVVPEDVSPAVSESSVTKPSLSASRITGASFVPVIVTVTFWVAVPPIPSSTVTVNSSTRVSPSAR